MIVWVVVIAVAVGVAGLIEWRFIQRAERRDREAAQKRRPPGS